MARLIKFTTILFLFFMLSACASNAAANSDPVRLTLQDAGETVILKPGDSLDIELEGNPSTGYTWQTANQELKTIRQAGETETLPAKSKLIGAAQTLVLHFTATHPGQETLKLVYQRAWEKGKEPAKSFEVTINVK